MEKLVANYFAELKYIIRLFFRYENHFCPTKCFKEKNITAPKKPIFIDYYSGKKLERNRNILFKKIYIFFNRKMVEKDY